MSQMEISSWEELFSTVGGNQVSSAQSTQTPETPTLLLPNGPIPSSVSRVAVTQSMPQLLRKTRATDLLTLEHSQVFSRNSELAAFQNRRGQQSQQGAHCRRGPRQELMSWAQTSSPTHSSNFPLLLSPALAGITPPLYPLNSISFLCILPTLGLESALLSPEGLPRRSGLQQAQVALISDLWCLNLPFPHSHYNLSTRTRGHSQEGSQPALP